MGESKFKKANRVPHIFVATPMYGGMCTGQFTRSMLQLVIELERRSWQYSYFFRYNESLITRGRNMLASTFLDTDATHLLFVDSDINFDAQEVLKMVDADKDVICGIYPMKQINWGSVEAAVKNGVPTDQLENHTGQWVVNFKNYEEAATTRMDTPFEIFNGGTGMMLIKRHVFEKMAEKIPHYIVNENDKFMMQKRGKKIPEFFTTSIDPDTGVLLSEDYHFCRVWREMGGTIWAAPWVGLDHVGTYVFSGRPQQS